jgi:hypothetical protein
MLKEPAITFLLLYTLAFSTDPVPHHENEELLLLTKEASPDLSIRMTISTGT